jgi:hypothetical protein
MWYVLSYVLSFCKCEKEIEFDSETIEVLKAIYNETAPSSESEGEESSEDEDYAPPENIDEDDGSDTDTDSDYERPEDEEIIIKRDKDGHYYLH